MPRTLIVTLLLTLSLSPALAQVAPVPPLVSFQGRLAKPDATPVPDGTYSLTFSLWDALRAGTKKWSQTFNPVQVKNGVFGVLLNLSTGPADLFVNNLWLEIQVGTVQSRLSRARAALRLALEAVR